MPLSQAVEAPDSLEIDTVLVEGRDDRTLAVGGMGMTLREMPQSVTVIDAVQIEEQGVRSLIELLSQTPGVTMQQSTSDEWYYTIRGQAVEAFQYDGLSFTNTSHLSSDPNMDMYERVEVLRGGDGVVSGSNGFGSINMIRKRPTDHLQAGVDLSYGRWDQKRLAMDVSGPVTDGGRLRARGIVSLQDREFFYDVAERTSKLYYGILEYDLSESLLLTVAAHSADTDSVPIIYGQPRYTTGGGLNLPRSVFLNPAWNKYRIDEQNYFFSLEKTSSGGWKTRLAANYQDAFDHYAYQYANGAINPVTLRGAVVAGQFWYFDPNQTSIALTTNGKFGLFGRDHELMAGLNWQEFRNSYKWADNGTGRPFDVFNYDPYAVPEMPNPPAVFGRTTVRTLVEQQSGGYVGVRFNLTDRLHLQTSARLSWWTYDGLILTSTGATFAAYDASVSRKLTPQAGVTYDVSTDWSAYASYSEIFTPQTNTTYTGELLQPRVGKSYEAGLKGELFGGRANMALTLFVMDDTNRPEQDFSPAASAGTFYLASGETRSKGFEAEISGTILSGWKVNGGYTYNANEVLAAAPGVVAVVNLPTPKHLVRVWSSYDLPVLDRKVSVSVGVNAQSKVRRPANAAATFFQVQGGYAIFNLRAAYRPTSALSFSLNLNNITDKTYVSYIHSSAAARAMYGEPRSYVLSASYSFF